MAIAVSRSNPETVYALIESDSAKDDRGLYVSTNAGKSWTQVTSEPRLIQRAWYYTELFVDPKNERTIYVLSAPALRSTDGGKTWQTLSGTHGDYHDMWINPDNPAQLHHRERRRRGDHLRRGQELELAGHAADGAVLPHQRRQPVPVPHLRRRSRTTRRSSSRAANWAAGASPPASWKASAGGESAFLAFDPDNPRYVMGGSYQGTIEVIDTEATAGTNIMAAPIQYLGMDAKDMKYRFNWNAPIIWSRHEPNTFYHGAQVLLKTTDMGKTWKEVSPDLTRNEKEKQGTPGVPVHQRGGRRRELRHAGLRRRVAAREGRDLDGERRRARPADARRRRDVEERHAEGARRVPGQRHRGLAVRQGARPTSPPRATSSTITRPGSTRRPTTARRGRRSTAAFPANAFTRVVREDDVRRDLLFAGTELGLFISWNGGRDWSPFQLNLPITPDHRPARPPGQPDRGHVGPVVLDPGRPRADPAVQAGHARPVPLPAGPRVPGQRRQRAERPRARTSPEPIPRAA